MRIGTWNLEGKWTPGHEQVLRHLDCDVLLLTENHPDVHLTGYHREVSAAMMGASKHWAGIFSRGLMTRQSDPHPASVGVETEGMTVVCSVFPWPLCGQQDPWQGSTPTQRMTKVVAQVAATLAGRSPVVWGGDWNQPLAGDVSGFGRASQAVITGAVDHLGMLVPTTDLPGRISGQRSIDHIAVSRELTVLDVGVRSVPRSLSDHDAYWVQAKWP